MIINFMEEDDLDSKLSDSYGIQRSYLKVEAREKEISEEWRKREKERMKKEDYERSRRNVAYSKMLPIASTLLKIIRDEGFYPISPHLFSPNEYVAKKYYKVTNIEEIIGKFDIVLKYDQKNGRWGAFDEFYNIRVYLVEQHYKKKFLRTLEQGSVCIGKINLCFDLDGKLYTQREYGLKNEIAIYGEESIPKIKRIETIFLSALKNEMPDIKLELSKDVVYRLPVEVSCGWKY